MIRLANGMLAALLCAALWTGAAGAASDGEGTEASTLDGAATYDLIFRDGTLDAVERGAELVYSRDVQNALKPEAATRDTGAVALTVAPGDTPLAQLQFRQDGKYRGLGSFPVSVGNPMIMYFYESVIRDMAESAGGSPFYIRNRVKEALVSASEIETGEAVVDGRTVETRTVRLYPFAGDPNTERMRGWGDLEMRVTMSDAVPGWYLSLVAEAQNGAVYRNALRFERVEPAP